MKIALGCDHAGYPLKEVIRAYLDRNGYEYEDFGTYNGTDIVEYPYYGKLVGEAVASGRFDRGMVFCGSGIGISIAACKVRGTRVCACSDYYSAKLSREHNDANILAMGCKVVGPGLAELIADVWLKTPFDAAANGGRHLRRVRALNEMIPPNGGTAED